MSRDPQINRIVNRILALLLLDSSSKGRYKLAEYIGQSQAITRSILSDLKDLKLVISQKGRSGTQLTPLGEKIVKRIKSYFRIDIDNSFLECGSTLVPEEKARVIWLFNNGDKSSLGVFERDLAVREGADGAIILYRIGDDWYFTGNERVKAVDLVVKNTFIVREYDFAVVSFGQNIGSACRGGAAIVLHYNKEKVIKYVDTG